MHQRENCCCALRRFAWVQTWWSRCTAGVLRLMAPEEFPDPVAVALAVGALLERLGIAYLVAGSLASSIHGEPRSTNDIDIVADLKPHHLDDLLAALADVYYVSPKTVREAVRDGGTFNVVHLATAVKVDVFVVGRDPFDAERIAHRARVRISPDSPGELYVDTAEHTILRKLEWYRRGDHVSERQWRDVEGIVRVQGSRLDRDRLRAWAPRLEVSDLLERLLSG